jgi:hypothetical protein
MRSHHKLWPEWNYSPRQSPVADGLLEPERVREAQALGLPADQDDAWLLPRRRGVEERLAEGFSPLLREIDLDGVRPLRQSTRVPFGSSTSRCISAHSSRLYERSLRGEPAPAAALANTLWANSSAINCAAAGSSAGLPFAARGWLLHGPGAKHPTS